MVKFVIKLLFLCLISETIFSTEINDREIIKKPLWEFGLFNGIAKIPGYRGSDESELYILPLPYLIYRGKIFQSDREGLRGIFYKNKHFESNISFFGNPPVDDDNKARRGMDDLDPILEIGPSVKYFLIQHNPEETMYFQISLRGTMSASNGVSLSYEGIHGDISLIYKNFNFAGRNKLRVGAKISLDYSDKSYNSYFYNVESQDATAIRTAFNSGGGYGGFNVSGNMIYKVNDKFSLGLLLRWENVRNAVYDNSPLVKNKDNFILGAALIWKLAKSKKIR